MSVLQIAEMVADLHPNDVKINYLANPPVELEEHYYNVKYTGLVDLGLEPHQLSQTLLSSLYDIADQWKHRADVLAMRPTVQWRDARATASRRSAA
jgi:UDP-sulfoquinovose synthase